MIRPLEVFTMRKILLATSALVAGSAIAASASAAEAPTVTMSGGIDLYYAAETNDEAEATRTDEFQYAPASTELRWDVNAEADNGLAYGGRVEWRPMSDAIDEIWIDLSGSFGTVVLGNDDGVGDNTVPHAGSALVGSYGFDGSYLAGSAANVGVAGGYGPSHGTADSTKISYYTPSFGGFSAGVSITPDDNMSGDTTTTANLTTGAVTSTTADNAFDNHIELMASFSGDFGGAAVKVAGQYQMAEADVDTNEDIDTYEIGATVGIAGFTIAAGYFDNGDSGVAKTGTQADAGTGFDIGVGYSFGATSVSVGYLSTEQSDTDGTEDEYSNLSFDVEYTVAEGLSAYAGVQFAESDDTSDATDAGAEDSTAVVIGTRLSF
jgi:hypothetical protein